MKAVNAMMSMLRASDFSDFRRVQVTSTTALGNVDSGAEPDNYKRAAARAAAVQAEAINARLIVVLSNSGATARLVSSFHPNIPIMAFCRSQKVGRQLILHRGVYPVVHEDSGVATQARVALAIQSAQDLGWLQSQDKVVIMASSGPDYKASFGMPIHDELMTSVAVVK